MTMQTRAAVIRESSGDYAIEPVQIGPLAFNEVLVRNRASGICHTDIIAQTRVPLPAVLGHEGAGIVLDVGPGVQRVRRGDQVILSYPSCGDCSGCASGAPYLCASHMTLAFAGMRSDKSQPLALHGQPISSAFFQQSSFAEHSVVPERSLVVVPKSYPPEMLAALACGVQTGAGAVLLTFRVGPLQSLVVFGAGAVGMSAIMAAHAAGARPIVAVDVLDDRLTLARELGATHVVNGRTEDVRAAIHDVAPNGIDFSLETSGNERSLEVAIACLRAGGECGMVIAPHLGEKYPFSPSEIFVRAAVTRGIIQGSAVPSLFIPKLLELHRHGRFPYERIIRTYPFEEINRALDDVKAGRVIKPVLTMSQTGEG